MYSIDTYFLFILGKVYWKIKRKVKIPFINSYELIFQWLSQIKSNIRKIKTKYSDSIHFLLFSWLADIQGKHVTCADIIWLLSFIKKNTELEGFSWYEWWFILLIKRSVWINVRLKFTEVC